MNNTPQQKLVRKLPRKLCDDDSVAFSSQLCLGEQTFIDEVMAHSKFTTIAPSEMNYKQHKLRSNSSPPTQLPPVWSDVFRLTNYVQQVWLKVGSGDQTKTELLAMPTAELNIIFREKEKVP